MRWAAFVNVLEHPPLLAIEVAAHECGGDGVASRDIRTLGVAKTRVTSLQFGQQVLYLLLEFFIIVASQDLVLPGFGQFLPIRPVHAGIEMLPRHKLTDAGINLLFRLESRLIGPPDGIGDPPSPTKTKAPQ